MQLQRRGELALKGLAIAIPVLLIYWNVFQVLIKEALFSESTSHIIAVPFLVGYLIYEKRESIKSLIYFENKNKSDTPIYQIIVGVILCITAYIMIWYGSYVFYTLSIQTFSIPIFISGIIIIFMVAGI